MITTAAYLDRLQTAAAAAETAEAAFRRETAARIKLLEEERAFAYRRLNFMRALADAVAAAENEEAAVARALVLVRAKLDWSGESEARTAILSRLAPIAKAVYARITPAEGTASVDIGEALAEFEQWYRAAQGAPFWVLFEHYIPETPRVDF
jgi:hypothetical protein